MQKLKDSEFNKIQRLIAQFKKEHPDPKQQTIQQLQAWITVHFTVQLFEEVNG